MALRELIATMRRDVTHVARNLVGRRPPPFMRRQRVGAETTVLEVREVRRETADAVSIVLARPDGSPLPFEAGQFFTLIVNIGGERLRRAYSASSSAVEESTVSVTVKRVAGGRASNYLNDHLRAGARLEVLGPSGSFGPAASDVPRHLVLVAGGSGITPIMSIVRTLLAVEPHTRLTLVYGNRRAEDIIFRAALAELAGARLAVRHVLAEPPPGWMEGTGMLDEATAARELAGLAGADGYYVCGPAPMMTAVRAALRGLGVDNARIHEERFFTPIVTRSAASLAPQRVTVRLRGKERQFVVAPGQTVLDAGLAAGVAMPFSCTMGGCAACRCRVVAGTLELEEPNCLTPDERAEGAVLACVARPTSTLVLEVP
jgi:ring-1,2-phenylacetyl-CoA epoxidase subunit PaaE